STSPCPPPGAPPPAREPAAARRAFRRSIPVADAFQRLVSFEVAQVAFLPTPGANLVREEEHAPDRDGGHNHDRGSGHAASLYPARSECQTRRVPELPDLVYVEEQLQGALGGRRITGARTGDPLVLRVMVQEPFPGVLVGRR